jgi:ATP-dependent protease HslVU (ClpYQ) peptidase subunit
VFLGGDSSAISEYDMLTIRTPKVIRKGEYVFGFAGHFRFAQIVEHAFKPPVYKGGDVFSFMSRQFMSRLQKCVAKAEFARNREGRMEGGLALIGFRGRLFCMQTEYELIEPKDGMFSIGCGFPYALGAMDALAIAEKNVERRVLLALQSTERYCSGVRSPFHIVKLPHEQEHHAGHPRRTRLGTDKPTKGSHRSGVRTAGERDAVAGYELPRVVGRLGQFRNDLSAYDEAPQSENLDSGGFGRRAGQARRR